MNLENHINYSSLFLGKGLDVWFVDPSDQPVERIAWQKALYDLLLPSQIEFNKIIPDDQDEIVVFPHKVFHDLNGYPEYSAKLSRLEIPSGYYYHQYAMELFNPKEESIVNFTITTHPDGTHTTSSFETNQEINDMLYLAIISIRASHHDREANR